MVLGLVALVACGGGGTETGEPSPPPPLDLSGVRVMLVPARAGEPPEVDPELFFWLGDVAPGTAWISPEEVARTVARTPGSNFRLEAPRRVVDIGGGQLRVQDPLYTDLRRLGAILDAGLALVPVSVRERTDSAGVVVDLTAALVSIRGGRVPWRHTVTGGPASTRSAAVADAAQALARSLTGGEAGAEQDTTRTGTM